jgi:hypothetical protein
MVGKTCKIGDFGLIKQLVSLFPLENSPFTSDVEKVDTASDTSVEEVLPPQNHNRPNLLSKKSSSDPSDPKEISPENRDHKDHHITKSIGTRIFASPEQWMANKENFDQRADIFSLGVVFLLLFHPMDTYMERINIIKDSKEGNIPESLEKELPEIANLIKSMLSLNPAARPCVEKIMQSLKLPSEVKSQLCGSVSYRKENATKWRKKYFRVLDNNLYVYNRENERKAENVFNFSHWQVTLEESLNSEVQRDTPKENGVTHSDELVSKPKDMLIKFQNPDQLGCEIRLADVGATTDLFKAFEEFKGAC